MEFLPIIVYCFIFYSVAWIEKVYVTMPPDHKEFLREITDNNIRNKFVFVQGGSSRHRSIYKGLLRAQQG